MPKAQTGHHINFIKSLYYRFETLILKTGPSVVEKLNRRIKVEPVNELDLQPTSSSHKTAFILSLVVFALLVIALSAVQPVILLVFIISLIVLLTIELEQGKL